ncbi:hypothetical protein DRP04_12580 [Archaeoglobales archaeon]|nr:MAG: hypothetical protein DRP04_12580 [Archaeoglobales archaeon]
MSKKCRWLHEALEVLPLIRYPFKLDMLPKNGIYFFYEDGEFWGHNGDLLRIVRIGTHRSDNFRNRIAEHFLFKENKMNFDKNRPKPSDRSIFRKNIGRALLNRDNDSYLEIWEIDFLPKENRIKYGHLRDIEKEKLVESRITEILRKKFSFRFIIIEREEERIGTKGLESKLIGTVARCKKCRPSESWLGRYSPVQEIRNSGLWLKQHLNASEIDEKDMVKIETLIQKTKKWIEANW